MAELRLKRDTLGRVTIELADLPGALGVYMRHRSPEPADPDAPLTRLSVFVRDVFASIEIDGDTLYHGACAGMAARSGPSSPAPTAPAYLPASRICLAGRGGMRRC